MLGDSEAFSSFSVDDTTAAKKFYGETLGMKCGDGPMGIMELKLPTGGHIMVYPKGKDHVPASFTVLNFPVKDIEDMVEKLKSKGVEFQNYDIVVNEDEIKTDEKGIARDEDFGPPIAWFTDPAGNILSLMQL